MKKKTADSPVGWGDWHVVAAMILFVVLLRCSVYFDNKLLECISYIPAIYGVLRSFSKIM